MVSYFLLIASAALLAFARRKRFVDYLNQKANGGGVNLVKVDGYFIGVSITLPTMEKSHQA